jgi:hypothetical protein
MKTFNEIYNSIKPDFTPQLRSIIDIGIILSKAYLILKAEKYAEYLPFDFTGSSFDTDRTTIERLLKELNDIKVEDDGIYVLQSEGVERAIADIKNL